MKAYKCFLLILVVAVLGACGGDSEDELIGNWVKRGDFSGPDRAFAASFVIGNKGYVIGGVNSGSKERRKDVYEYTLSDPANGVGSWIRVDDFPGDGREQAVAFTINGIGYVGTGWNGEDNVYKDFWAYNPATRTWSAIAPLPDKAAARYNAVAFSLDGRGFVGTGFTAGADQMVLNDFWAYDPGTDSWAPVTGYGGSKRRGATAFILNDGQKDYAYVCTGYNTSDGSSVADMWRFGGVNSSPDPDGNYIGDWKSLRKITNSNSSESYDDDYLTIVRQNSASFTMNGKGYVAGGTGNSTVWEYEPPVYDGSGNLLSGDLWIERSSFNVANGSPSSREGATAFSFPRANTSYTDDIAFMGLGRTGTSAYYSDFRQFFPTQENNFYDD